MWGAGDGVVVVDIEGELDYGSLSDTRNGGTDSPLTCQELVALMPVDLGVEAEEGARVLLERLPKTSDTSSSSRGTRRTCDSVQRDLKYRLAIDPIPQTRETYEDVDSALVILDLGLERRAERALSSDSDVRELEFLELLEMVDFNICAP